MGRTASEVTAEAAGGRKAPEAAGPVVAAGNGIDCSGQHVWSRLYDAARITATPPYAKPRKLVHEEGEDEDGGDEDEDGSDEDEEEDGAAGGRRSVKHILLEFWGREPTPDGDSILHTHASTCTALQLCAVVVHEPVVCPRTMLRT